MKNQRKEEASWIDEFQTNQRYGLLGKILIVKKSAVQKITIVETERYGNGLLLDDCWMTTEKQEKDYHECLVHPAMCGAESLERILIIGGGDGGSARECLRHTEVKHLDLIEIDQEVINLCQEYLPKIGGTAWSDPRLNLKIRDGIQWVENTKDNSYDVIIVDGSDPKGPAQSLFNRSFFENCKRILKKGGVFAAQTESPEAFYDAHMDTVKMIKTIFEYADPMYGSVPIYPSGWWSWTFAAKDQARYLHPSTTRASLISMDCKIWSPRWQQGAFNAIPAYVERALKQ
ncbi:polyamine aminopropyltransferase [Prochlorococcus sp. MIT 1223]|uniref:polyamine aminopropyltransferase n=1 Tax=Prochlorococcus sp. MIT 1223 TaxID=3096217 RepID=UPI002A7536F8|nr:polyamine aminopropyltransferase [Prochlorococcus sp. MIT 1223]